MLVGHISANQNFRMPGFVLTGKPRPVWLSDEQSSAFRLGPGRFQSSMMPETVDFLTVQKRLLVRKKVLRKGLESINH